MLRQTVILDGVLQLVDMLSLTWTSSWPGSSEAAQHVVFLSRKDGHFSPAEGKQGALTYEAELQSAPNRAGFISDPAQLLSDHLVPGSLLHHCVFNILYSSSNCVYYCFI